MVHTVRHANRGRELHDHRLVDRLFPCPRPCPRPRPRRSTKRVNPRDDTIRLGEGRILLQRQHAMRTAMDLTLRESGTGTGAGAGQIEPRASMELATATATSSRRPSGP